MKLKKLNDRVFLFTAETRKELTLSFFRVQEYYESPLKGLNRQKFNTFDFLNESMDDDGKIDYFSYWCGFNIPGNIFNDWRNNQDVEHVTPLELKMFEQLGESGVNYDEPFYIIGSLEGVSDIIKHEIAHALYFTNVEYNKEMFELTVELKNYHNSEYVNLQQKLLEMGYCEEVLDDEIQAYLSSEKKRYLLREFALDFAKISKIIKKYRAVLQKYNTFDF
jgi:hypothetical protein